MNLKDCRMIIEPPHDKTNRMICVPSEDSVQPGHPPSQIRVFTGTQWVAEDPMFLHVDDKDSDQTGRMPRLIWVFAGHTYHIDGFVMRRLILTAGFDRSSAWKTIKRLE